MAGAGVSDNGTAEQRFAWLAQQLDDAHLVIGQQQVLLLRQQRRLAELEQQLDARKEEGWQDSHGGDEVLLG